MTGARLRGFKSSPENRMTITEFKSSLKKGQPPEGLADLLAALWFDARDDWDQAHRIAQSIADTDGSWVHAYLHRKEGDLSNAGYWYNRAGRSFCTEPLEAEWESLLSYLLAK